MTIHVNIGEAKTRFSELVKAALRGEDVIVSRAGKPQVKLTAIGSAGDEERKRRGARRLANIGYAGEAAKGFDLSVKALKRDRDPERRERKARGADL